MALCDGWMKFEYANLSGQGSDITASNTRLVRQGDLFKISSTGWTRDIILFLYDKELVLCKKVISFISFKLNC